MSDYANIMIDALEHKVERLEGKLAKLEARNNELLSRIECLQHNLTVVAAACPKRPGWEGK